MGVLYVDEDPDRILAVIRGVEKCGVLRFGGIQWLACCAISPSAETVVKTTALKWQSKYYEQILRTYACYHVY